MKCRRCESGELVKNGHNACGTQQYLCKACRWRGVLEPKVKYTEAEKERIIAAYQERSSMRGIRRVFGVARGTLASWIKKNDANNSIKDISSSEGR